MDPGVPLQPSVLTLTPEDVDHIDMLISMGQLPSDWFEKCEIARQNNCFGHDHKLDRHGRPIEQGIGSESHVTANSVAAYRKWGINDPEYPRHLAKLEKLLVEQQPKREAAALAAREAERLKRQARR